MYAYLSYRILIPKPSIVNVFVVILTTRSLIHYTTIYCTAAQWAYGPLNIVFICSSC